jgi:hypothetical protein
MPTISFVYGTMGNDPFQAFQTFQSFNRFALTSLRGTQDRRLVESLAVVPGSKVQHSMTTPRRMVPALRKFS